MAIGYALLAFVIAQRLGELVYANANTKRLLAKGGVEHEAGHYYLLVAVHVFWIASLLWLAPGRPVSLFFLLAYGVLQLARVWVFVSLGRRWTTRIITVPGETLVKRGPYKYVSHPNYLVVIAEIACLPLVYGLWQHAVIFSALNLAALYVRLKDEEKALAPLMSKTS